MLKYQTDFYNVKDTNVFAIVNTVKKTIRLNNNHKEIVAARAKGLTAKQIVEKIRKEVGSLGDKDLSEKLAPTQTVLNGRIMLINPKLKEEEKENSDR